MEIYLPKLFELMSQPDPARIREWHVAVGDIVQPGANLLTVRAPGKTITIPTPPELTVPHQVISISDQPVLYMGDFVMKLEPVSPPESA